MLRYIYLLCFIINFKFVFCYNYINSQTNRGQGQSRVGRQKEPRLESRLQKRQDYGFEDKLVDQIDVVTFIQKPDYDYEPYIDSKRQPKSHNIFRKFEEYNSASVPRDRREPLSPHDPHDPHAFLALQDQPSLAPHKLNLSPNDHDARVAEETTLNSYQQKMLADRQLVHNPKKKCSFTKIFPFFSHNKAVHDKKGTKKKKPCDTCSTKIKKNHEPFTDTEHVGLRKKKKKQERFMDEAGINKRYAQRASPKCKMKYNPRKKRWDLPKIIHNSRQYYANLNSAPKETIETSSKPFEKVNVKKRFNNEIIAARSQSPGQDYMSQVKQQFKTLEELERRVDNVQI